MGARQTTADKVLIVTGGIISATQGSMLSAVKRQFAAHKASSGAWLDIQAKVAIAGTIMARQLYLKSKKYKSSAYYETAQKLFVESKNIETPELAEVMLATLLHREGVAFECATYTELHSNPRRRKQLLKECKCIFASTTLLRDRAEMIPMFEMLKRNDNYLVAGGALVNMIWDQWSDAVPVDMLAVGYGEMLVPSIVEWIRGGYKNLQPPITGRVQTVGSTPVLFSGVPDSNSLDDLPTPDWSCIESYYQKRFDLVYYESVRGCPYRCMICNYPFLFEDKKLRYRSAEQIALDWEGYVKMGVKCISALDSLFTMPKKRLVTLCQLLIERKVNVKWICYARASDLDDLATARLMKRAGCYQVHMGIESGSQTVLDNMNKHCTVEQNKQALINCREAGITTAVTIIIGFPGETEETVRQSYALLETAPPDLYFTAALNTRFEKAPLLEEENASRFGLVSVRDGKSSIPYWHHDTMCCSQTGRWLKWFNRKMALNKVALDCSLFLNGFYNYVPEYREELLAFQYDVISGHPRVEAIFGWLDAKIQRKLEDDVIRLLGKRGELVSQPN